MSRVVLFLVGALTVLIPQCLSKPTLSEEMWQTISQGHELRGQCLRPAFISNTSSWPKEVASYHSFDPNQFVQLAYEVGSNRFGHAFRDNRNMMCAFFEQTLVCDRFRVLAAKYPGAYEYACLAKKDMDALNPAESTPVQYLDVQAVALMHGSLIGNYGTICAGGELCAKFYGVPGNEILIKGTTGIDTSVCFIVRKQV